MNVPKLRFKEFNDEWNLTNIRSISSLVTKGTTPKRYEDKGINFVKVENIHDNIISNISAYISEDTHNKELKRSILKENDILFSIAGALGRTAIVKTNNLPANTNQANAIIRIENLDNIDLYYLLNRLNHSDITNHINKCQSVGAQPNLSLEQVNNINISLPSKKEQIKIGNLLRLIDKKIELQSKKIEDLKLFKLYTKNVMFKNFDKQMKLKDILIKWNRKNKDNSIDYVESISNKYGFISQSEQFEDRNVASKDLSKYYIIEKNVFGYNPSRLNVGSLALKTDGKVSVVSPLYECFTTTQNNKFLLEWFGSIYFKKETISKFEGGVRNTLNFSNLCDININLPSMEKQNKYATILSSFDTKILLEETKLNKLLQLKKGLMQNMFV